LRTFGNARSFKMGGASTRRARHGGVLERPSHLLCLSAKDNAALVDLSLVYADYFTATPGLDVADICYAAAATRDRFHERLAITAATLDEMQSKLRAFAVGKLMPGVAHARAGAGPSQTAFLFTGQGADYVGMGRELYKTQITFKNALDRCDAILKDFLPFPLSVALFEEDIAQEERDKYAQVVLFSLGYALSELWRSWGIEPQAVMGHSVGELVAACAAEIFSLEHGLGIVLRLSKLTQTLSKTGAMGAIAASEKIVAKEVVPFAGRLSIAAVNGQESVVIAGETEAVQTVLRLFKERGVRVKLLPVAHAFHSPQMDPILAEYEKILSEVELNAPRVPLISSLTGKLLSASEARDPTYWRRLLREPVMFFDGMKELFSRGFHVFVEMGPGAMLCGMGQQCKSGAEAVDGYHWLPSLTRENTDWRQVTEGLGTLYSTGSRLDWRGWEQGCRPRKKIPLPSRSTRKKHVTHPFLTSHCDPAVDGKTRIFECKVSSERPAFLRDHVVHGDIVMPGAAYFEMALASASELFKTGPYGLCEVTIQRPLFLHKNKIHRIQIILDRVDHRDYGFQIFSKIDVKRFGEERGNDWTLHVSGKLRTYAEEPPTALWPREPLNLIRNRCRRKLSPSAHYTSLAKKGLKYGPRFRMLKKIWKGEREVLAELSIPNSFKLEASHYRLHPALLDGWLHPVAVCLETHEKTDLQRVFVPTGMDELVCYRAPTNQMWSHVICRPIDASSHHQRQVADLQLIGEDGGLIAELRGLTLAEVSSAALRKSVDVGAGEDDLLFEVKWYEQAILKDAVPLDPQSTWLILGKGHGIGAALARRVNEAGGHAVIAQEVRNGGLTADFNEFDPSDSGSYHRIIENVARRATADGKKLRRIVHLLSVGEGEAHPLDSERIRNAQETGYRSSLNLIQAMLRSSGLFECRLVLVTRGAQSVQDENTKERLHVEQAPIWGLARVAAIEHPELRCIRVDLGAEDWEVADPTFQGDVLFNELDRNATEDQLAFRGKIRFVARVVQSPTGRFMAAEKAKRELKRKIRRSATYLITGGFGGIGLEMARWMVLELGAKKLALLGRKPPDAHTQKTLDSLKTAGAKILILQGDIADPDDAARIFSEIAKTRAPLRGIIHSAGVLDDGLIRQQTWERYSKVAAPKIWGAWNLYHEANSQALDFFVLFSSLTSINGNMGQANYAAANVFMDTFALSLSKLGIPALSVSWGAWGEVGMAAKLGTVERKRLVEAGIDSFSNRTAKDALARLMTGNAAHVAIARINWSQYIQTLPEGANPPFLSTVGADGFHSRTATKGRDAQALLPFGRLENVSSAQERKDVLIDVLVNETKQLLRLPPETSVDFRRGLMEMGVDSILAIRFRNRLIAVFGEQYRSQLAVTLIFDYPTIEKLSEYLLREVLLVEEKTNFLEVRESKKSPVVSDEPIAVIGMACRFPGSGSDPEAYWKLLSGAGNAIREVPPERWSVDTYYDPNPETAGKSYVKRGGFIDGVDLFDPLFFNISPADARLMDPQHRLLFEVAWEALENAGEAPDTVFGSQTGIYVGISFSDYYEIVRASGEVDGQGALGNIHSAAVGRLSYFLGAQGPSIAVDTVCSSSLVAIHLACQSLRDGSSSRALVGGVNLNLGPENFVILSKLRALSRDGTCKTFDASADGFARGEGCGMLVLKRLSDAIRNQDQILAVVRGSAINQNGRSSSLTAPSSQAQEALIRDALHRAQVRPQDLSYVEAHGTGTSLGDPIEVHALAQVFKEGRDPAHPLVIGSVKTNFGHLEPAAGVAGMIKTILALRHRKIPPHLHFETPNPDCVLSQIPAIIPTQLMEWMPLNGRRIAGISAFGMTGTNAHVVIEESPEATQVEKLDATERPVHVLVLSGRNEPAMLELVGRYIQHLTENPGASLGDICYTAAVGRSHFEERLSVVCRTNEEAVDKLKLFLSGTPAAGSQRGTLGSGTPGAQKLAFLFSGQGSQYEKMGHELYRTQRTFRTSIDRCEKILAAHLKEPLRKVLFGEHPELIQRTEYAQPTIFALEYSLAELWKSWGIVPQAVLGHSVGEYVAACVAGVFSLEDGLKLIAQRGRLMQKLPGAGAMSAIAVSEERIREAIYPYNREGERISVAAINGAESVVMAGDADLLRKVSKQFTDAGVKVKGLTVSHAFHSPQMDPILEEFEKLASEVQYSNPKICLISNLYGRKFEKNETPDAGYWRRHLRETVRFADGMKALFDDRFKLFVEIGAGTTLCGMGQSCAMGRDPASDYSWNPSLKKDRQDWLQLAESVGQLFSRGAKFDWLAWEKDCPPRNKVSLPTYAFQRKRYWVENHSTKGEKIPPSKEQDDASSPLSAQPSVLDRLTNLSETGYQPYLSEFIILKIRQVLGLDSTAAFDRGRDLSEMGMDSLSAIKLQDVIRSAFDGKLEIPTTFIFEQPTVDHMNAYLERSVALLLNRPANVIELHSADGLATPDERSGQWVKNRAAKPNARLRLFCFPYAGGGAQIFDRWSGLLPDAVEPCPVQLPGRWERSGEAPIVRMDVLVEAVYAALGGKLDKPFAVLGYSFGGTVAFEWLRLLAERGGPLPTCFFPMASPAPQFFKAWSRKIPLSHLNDREFLEKFQEILGGIPQELMKSPALQKMFVPSLRADVQVLENYSYQSGRPFDFPIIPVGGRSDHWAPVESLEGWKEHSTRPCQVKVIEGDHFFIQTGSANSLIQLLTEQLVIP
jgi:acyl transferase domain-containing protein/surfactin synthase thioesterase subunit/NADP-dependent 3-hydroxy acid dehydrogenase YdfG